MNRTRWLCIGTAILFALLAPLTGNQKKIAAQYMKQRVVRILGTWMGKEAATGLEPKELWIDRGTTVTWVNESEVGIQMKFFEGEDCKQVSSKAVGQWVKRRKCVLTRHAQPPKGTIVVTFTETGRYGYEVIYAGKNMREKGVVEVRGTF